MAESKKLNGSVIFPNHYNWKNWLNLEFRIKGEKIMDRIERSKEKFKESFGVDLTTENDLDPEFTEIMTRFIFGDVAYAGNLDSTISELITLVVMTTNQTLPQLKEHIGSALNKGATPVQIKESIYQCAPFIGFSKVLIALDTVNEVFAERNITLPIESQRQVNEEERYKKGLEIQFPIYGNEIKDLMKELPGGLGEAISRYLTEVCFGDFYTRTGLDIKTRELLMLCVLATLGADKQILAHTVGNIKVGNSKETILTAIVHCLPLIGFPRTFNAINIIKGV